MKIVQIRLSKVRVPLHYAYVSSNGVKRHYLKTIVRLTTETGLVGFGETDGSDAGFDRVCDLAAEFLGEDPLNCARLEKANSAIEHGAAPVEDRIAFGGIEMACWDIAGKHYDKPVCQLLGGYHRTRVDMVCELSAGPFSSRAPSMTIDAFFDDVGNIDQVIAAAQAEIDRSGYQALKLKSVGRNPDWDLRAMKALRASLGEKFHLRHDPNAAYPLQDALDLYQRMEDLGLQWLEDPTSTIQGMRRVRSGVSTPLATNMCVIDFTHLERAIQLDAVDIVGIDVFHWGGLSNASKAIAVCEANGLGVFFHCFFDLGITTAAMLHLAASVCEPHNGIDTCLYLQAADVIVDGKFDVTDGSLPVPTGPGLGVALDEEALAKMTTEQIDRCV